MGGARRGVRRQRITIAVLGWGRTPGALPIDVEEFLDLAAIYDVVELATAMKPLLLETMVRDHGSVAYLDSDLFVDRRLLAGAQVAADAAIAAKYVFPDQYRRITRLAPHSFRRARAALLRSGRVRR